jgi:hypothetical protein
MQEFFPAYADKDIHKFADAQAAAAVRADSTLIGSDFTGGELNDRGRERLDTMFSGTPQTTVYLNFPESDMMDKRREQVQLYARTKGIDDTTLKFVSGPNPARYSPAAGHLTRMPRSESTGGASTSMQPGAFTSGSDGSNAR